MTDGGGPRLGAGGLAALALLGATLGLARHATESGHDRASGGGTPPGKTAPPVGLPPGSGGGSRGPASTFRVAGKVVHGEGRRARSLDRIGVVDIGRCFDAIPEYRKVRELPNTRAKYYFFLKDANEKFRRAVRAVATAERLEVVVEKGGVEGGDRSAIVDLTAPVVARLSDDDEGEKR